VNVTCVSVYPSQVLRVSELLLSVQASVLVLALSQTSMLQFGAQRSGPVLKVQL